MLITCKLFTKCWPKLVLLPVLEFTANALLQYYPLTSNLLPHLTIISYHAFIVTVKINGYQPSNSLYHLPNQEHIPTCTLLLVHIPLKFTNIQKEHNQQTDVYYTA